MRRILKHVVVLTFAFALAPGVSRAQWTGEGIPLCGERGWQFNPEIAPDGFGGLLAAWVDARGPLAQVFARRLTADGLSAPGWPESGVRVPPAAPWEHGWPQVAPDGNGGMFVGWVRWDDQQPSAASFVQHLLPDGSRDPAWPDTGVAVVPRRGNILGMVADGAGGVSILMSASNDGLPPYTLWAQRLTAAGVPAPGWTSAGVDIGPGGAGSEAVGDGAGGLIVGIYTGAQMRARHVTGSGGAPDWDVLLQNTVGGTTTGVLDLETDGAGGAYILMKDVNDYLQRLDATGARPTGWAFGRRLTNAQGSVEQFATLVADGTGGVYVSWVAALALQPSHVWVKRFDADGTDGDGWPDTGVPVESGHGNVPRMAPRVGGGVFVAWQDSREPVGPIGSNIYLNALDHDGTRLTGWDSTGVAVCTALFDQDSPVLASDGAGGTIVVWSDDRNRPVGKDGDLYAARVLGDATVGVAVSAIAAEAFPDRVTLVWQTSRVSRATIERAVADGPWAAILIRTPDGTGRIAYEDRLVAPAVGYRYRLRLDDGTTAGEVAVTIPVGSGLSLAGAWPHPASPGSSLSFELDRAGEVEVTILDVSGREIGAERVTLGAGRHLLPLARLGVRTRGAYLARLRHEGRSLTRRVVVR